MNGWPEPDDVCAYCPNLRCTRPDIYGSALDSDGGRRFDNESMRPDRTAEAMFGKIKLAPRTGCWVWCGSLNQDGYGKVWYHGAWVFAHRAFYAELNGDILGDLQLDHLCRNRPCVNPWHLDPVTHAVNNHRRWTEPIADDVLREMPGVAA